MRPKPSRVSAFRNCFGTIWSVSTLTRSSGITMPVCVLKGCICSRSSDSLVEQGVSVLCFPERQRSARDERDQHKQIASARRHWAPIYAKSIAVSDLQNHPDDCCDGHEG